jgi:hypothetical protein
MVLNDLNFKCIAVSEPKANPPRSIDRHRPEPFAISGEFVKIHRSQWAEIFQRSGGIQAASNSNAAVSSTPENLDFPLSANFLVIEFERVDAGNIEDSVHAIGLEQGDRGFAASPIGHIRAPVHTSPAALRGPRCVATGFFRLPSSDGVAARA